MKSFENWIRYHRVTEAKGPILFFRFQFPFHLPLYADNLDRYIIIKSRKVYFVAFLRNDDNAI